jgi:hypothetical protein
MGINSDTTNPTGLRATISTPADRDDIERLVRMAAAQEIAIRDGNVELAYGYWASMPDHLQTLINDAVVEIEAAIAADEHEEAL